jgi:hypothetical protein
MRIKRFNEINKTEEVSENIDADILGITTNTGRRTGTRNPNRRTQYFYDYYTGKKITGKSKYELNSKVFDLAKRDDELGLLAQFCLQVERDSMTTDYSITGQMDKGGLSDEFIKKIKDVSGGNVDRSEE